MFNNKHFDTCLLSRLTNVLIHGINKKDRLPKAIVIVLDNDLIRFANHDAWGITQILHDYIIWLADRFQEILKDYKDKLPLKSKRENYPKILWAESPLHDAFEDNHLRKQYNAMLHEILDDYTFVMPIRLKKEWDPKNANLFAHNRFTSSGLDKYWGSIDSSFRHWETIVEKNGRFRRAEMHDNFQQSIYGRPPQIGRFQDARYRINQQRIDDKRNRYKWVRDDRKLNNANVRRNLEKNSYSTDRY